jgi:hypothetical protein
MKPTFPLTLATLACLIAPLQAHAQWITQSFVLKPGWNAVYLNVDASHASLDTLIGSDASNPIREVWLWQPAPATLQFITSPQVPSGSGSQWVNWDRSLGPGSSLHYAVGNAAYLVRNTNATAYTWNLKGRPVPFRFLWTSTGLNLLGFPTPTNSPPSFDNFLAPASSFYQSAQIFHYLGGELTNNPARLYTPRTYPVTRGEAFWIRSGDAFNHYFGPFEVALAGSSGIQFRDTLGQSRLRLRNLSGGNLTVSLRLLASETAPTNQIAIAGPPPLLLRGALNTTNLTYAHTNLVVGSQPNTFALAPSGQAGSEIEVVVGLNRSLMSGAAGASYAGILRFTDSLGLSQHDIPVSAEVASTAGLWVGAASVSQVRAYLKSYQKDGNGAPVIGTNNAYVVTGINTNLGAVSRPFPLRLILHSDASGTNTFLMQRAYYGLSPGTNYINATRESFLDPAQLAFSRRISAVHLPFTPTNTVWKCTGLLQSSSNLTVTVTLPYGDHAANPFLHTYHPDHDNLGTDFATTLAQGVESYTVTRVIRLTFTPPPDDFASLAGSGLTLAGTYNETVTLSGRGTESRSFDTQGTFSLNRLNSIPTLTTQ